MYSKQLKASLVGLILFFFHALSNAQANAYTSHLIYPSDDLVVNQDELPLKVTFKWQSSDSFSENKIKLYTSPTGKPFRVIRVKDSNITLAFSEQLSTIWWNVTIKGKPISEKHFRLNLNHPRQFKFKVNLSQTTSKYSHQADSAQLNSANTKETLAGQTIAADFQYLPQEWRYDFVMNFGIEHSALAKNQNSYTETKLYGAFGRKFAKKIDRFHLWLIGIHQNSVSLNINETRTGQINMNFLSGKYLFTKNISTRSTFEMAAELRVLVRANSSPPSFKLAPSYYYLIKPDLFLTGFLVFDKTSYKTPYGNNLTSGDLMITTQNLSAGLGLMVNF